MKLILAALLLGLAHALPNTEAHNSTENVTPTEETLVRCPRVPCTKFCRFGQQEDDKGCPICQCLEDPCLEGKCPMGQKCIAQESCAGHPCTELPYVCERYPCPQVLCGQYCEFGMSKNENGCDTCDCLNNPCNDVECLVEEQCKVIDDPNCPPGAYCNKVGQCEAVAPIRSPEEPMLPKCPLIQCSLLCRFGYKKNEKGCNTCTCKSNPCEDVRCGDGEKCQHESLDKCQHDICDLETKCSVQPICEHVRQQYMDKLKMLVGGRQMVGGLEDVSSKPHVLACDDRGRFRPRQCDYRTSVCWCVNDLGKEIEGTRSAEKKPECPYNKTHTVEGHLQLQHNIDKDLEKHTENLKPILVTHLGEWLMIQEKYIQEVVITPYGENIQTLRVDFVIRGEVEDDLDLASSVHHLHLKVKSEETLIHYESFTLTPVPTSLETHHQFHAEPMAHPYPLDGRRSAWDYYGRHKTTIVVLIGLVLMASILVVMLVQVMKKRKVLKLHRKDNYQQNLAFTNEVYGKLAFLDDLAKDHAPLEKEKALEKDLEKNEATA